MVLLLIRWRTLTGYRGAPGGRKENPWVHLFDDRMNFIVGACRTSSQNGRTVLLEGMDVDSTSAAAELITSETQMEHFKQMLKVKDFP
jgi:hypothetical protein